MSKNIALSLLMLFQFSSCQLFQDKKNSEVVTSETKTTSKTYTFLADELPMPSKRKVAGENNFKCDLASDRCNGKDLSEAQKAKTYFLTAQVAEKLSEIEKTENLAGREFKVAIIGRMGSNLEKFQPLKDKDSNGKTMTIEQLVAKMQEQTQIDGSSKEVPPPQGSIDPQTMSRDFYDRSRRLKYSHMGIAIKNMELKNKEGKVVTNSKEGYWTMVHLLYSCEDQKRAYVFKGTLSSFFYDHMNDYGAQILVPEVTLQNNVEDILVKDYIGKNWIEKQYNAIALSNDLNQQNSNQWVLEVLAAALYPSGQVTDRAQAQAILQKTNYSETKITPTGLYSALQVPFVSKIVSNFMPTVCMQYQPTIQKYGIGRIITALSLEEYLANIKRLSAKYEVELTKGDMKEIDSNLPTKVKKEKTN